ncbi:MAG: hypothetical protein A2V65_07330 [Deltaproteobacteria bacterium RBG_13_49_15]|nr:MAG: hypothetical protein A2V65_07330 [Deltaproteobacteria bacterium RBG_13_49_15]
MPHLLRCQGLAVKYYGFALGRLGSGATSAFATTGFIQLESEVYSNEVLLEALKHDETPSLGRLLCCGGCRIQNRFYISGNESSANRSLLFIISAGGKKAN